MIMPWRRKEVFAGYSLQRFNEVQNKVSINKKADELPKQSFADWK